MRNYSLRFICLLSVTGILTSCGKRVEEVKSSQSQVGREIASNSLLIQYSHSTFTTNSTLIPRNANFRIPEYFPFESQSVITKPFEILYNFIQQPLSYEFRCIYTANNEEKYFTLDYCLNSLNQIIGNVSGVDFILDAGKEILMHSAEPNIFEATINLQIDWK